MKNIVSKLVLGLMMLSASLTFTACGDDDEEPAYNFAKQIVGEWVVEEDLAEDVIKGDQFHFLSGGVAVWTGVNGDWQEHGTYTLKGDELTVIWDDGDGDIEKMSGIIFIDGNQMSYGFTWYWSYDDEYSYNNALVLRKVK